MAKRVYLSNYKAKSEKPHDFDAQRSLQISTSNVYVRRYVFRRPTRTLLAKWGHRTSGPRNARAEEAVLPQTWCGRRGCPRARQARALRAHLARLIKKTPPTATASATRSCPSSAGATEEFSHRDQRSVASNPCACLDRFGVNPFTT